jgi:hypothetical protein
MIRSEAGVGAFAIVFFPGGLKQSRFSQFNRIEVGQILIRNE